MMKFNKNVLLSDKIVVIFLRTIQILIIILSIILNTIKTIGLIKHINSNTYIVETAFFYLFSILATLVLLALIEIVVTDIKFHSDEKTRIYNEILQNLLNR